MATMPLQQVKWVGGVKKAKLYTNYYTFVPFGYAGGCKKCWSHPCICGAEDFGKSSVIKTIFGEAGNSSLISWTNP